MITLVPVGEIDQSILGALGDRLEQTFAQQPVRIDSGLTLPKAAGDTHLQQYLSTHILARLPKSVRHPLRRFLNSSEFKYLSDQARIWNPDALRHMILRHVHLTLTPCLAQSRT